MCQRCSLRQVSPAEDAERELIIFCGRNLLHAIQWAEAMSKREQKVGWQEVVAQRALPIHINAWKQLKETDLQRPENAVHRPLRIMQRTTKLHPWPL